MCLINKEEGLKTSRFYGTDCCAAATLAPQWQLLREAAAWLCVKGLRFGVTIGSMR
jgi:hypothetical protein